MSSKLDFCDATGVFSWLLVPCRLVEHDSLHTGLVLRHHGFVCGQRCVFCGILLPLQFEQPATSVLWGGELLRCGVFSPNTVPHSEHMPYCYSCSPDYVQRVFVLLEHWTLRRVGRVLGILLLPGGLVQLDANRMVRCARAPAKEL